MSTEKDQVRITGQLHDDAQLAYTAQTPPVAVLSFEIHPAKGRPYRVRQVLGTDQTVHMVTAAKLRAMRRGDWVAVYGSGLRDQSDHGVCALVVLDVTDVHPISSPSTTRARTAHPSQEAL